MVAALTSVLSPPPVLGRRLEDAEVVEDVGDSGL
jgi:hypothetical protein